MKVLLISHGCRSRSTGQQKAQFLATEFGVQLRVIVPSIWNDSWNDAGAWKTPEWPIEPAFSFSPLKVRWPWLGPAQSYLHCYPQLRSAMEDFKPDVINLWEEPWGLVSAHTCWLRDRILPRAKIICETEQNIFKKLPAPFGLIQKYTLKRADLMVGRSTEALHVLRQKGFKGPATVVPNAVDGDLFRPLDRTHCRTELGVSGFVVGYVGRLVEAKGLKDLLEAIALCSDPVNLVIVGNGPFKSEIICLIDKLNLEKRVKMIGALPAGQLPPVLNAMDVLAVPSRTTPRWKEQFGRVIIEAHACGVAVVGSDSGAISQVIGNGGLVVPERNPEALADAFKFLLKNQEERVPMGRIGRSVVNEQYTWIAVSKRMYDLYDYVLAQPNSGDCESHEVILQGLTPLERV